MSIGKTTRTFGKLGVHPRTEGVFLIEIGKRTPLHCTAVGKAIMAYLSKDEVYLILKEKGLEKFTENTSTNKKDLENEFKKIREQGYAVDNMEHEEGVRCVAGPI